MPSELADLCGEIRAHHRRRVFAMEQRKRADLALLAFLRTQSGWSLDRPAIERTAIANYAKALVIHAERRIADKPTEDAPEGYDEWAMFIEGTVLARRHTDELESAATKLMERLAAQLPVWEAWGKGVRGFSVRGLAVIVGEAGDLANYPKKGHLWKRMCLAVMGDGDGLDDHRQGNPGTNAGKADWIAEGYSKQRRSRMFVIGDSLIKTQGPYREVYLGRKVYEVARAEALGLTVAPAAKIPDKRKAEFRSDGHVHRRAQRYMEKRLLRDLWRAWRGVG